MAAKANVDGFTKKCFSVTIDLKMFLRPTFKFSTAFLDEFDAGIVAVA